MGRNVQRLGDILANRMKKTAGAAVPTAIELGTINSNLSLTTDSLQAAIPQGDYMVGIQLAQSTYAGVAEGELPANFRPLQAGDRVLVAWCGNEPVVIMIAVSS